MLTHRDPICWKTEESWTLLTSFQPAVTDKTKSPKTDRYTMQLTQVESKQKHNVWIEMLTSHWLYECSKRTKGLYFWNYKRRRGQWKSIFTSLLLCWNDIWEKERSSDIFDLKWCNPDELPKIHWNFKASNVNVSTIKQSNTSRNIYVDPRFQYQSLSILSFEMTSWEAAKYYLADFFCQGGGGPIPLRKFP